MLNPGSVLFLCVVVAGCSGSLRELKQELRAKRARALGLQMDECYGEQGTQQCGYCYPEDHENPRNWAQCQGQVSPPQPQLMQGVPGQGYSGQDASNQRFPGMQPGQTFPGQNPMNQQQLPGHHQNNHFPGISPMVQNFPGQPPMGQPIQDPNSQHFPGHNPIHQNLPGPLGTPGPVGLHPGGLPSGVNPPHLFTEDGQPRFPGISPPQTDFAHRWRSPLPVQPDEQPQQSSMAPANPNPYQYPGPRDQSYQQYPELPGEKLRKKLDALLHTPKQPSSKYSIQLSPNFHHPQAHHSSKFGDAHPPKINVLPPPKISSYPKFSDAMQQTAESEAESGNLPSEWTQQLPYGRKPFPKSYDPPSTTTTPKPLSSFFKDFLPKYVETVPPRGCPISHIFQEAEQQAPPEYEQEQPRQHTSPYDQHTPQDRRLSHHHFDSPNGPPFGLRSHCIPKPFHQN